MATNPQLKRAYWHDYRSPCRYMITLSKSPDIQPFSSISGDWRVPVGTRGSSYTRWSATGQIIANLIYNIHTINISLKAEQYIVMPDHVHILLWVQSELPEHLGFYIARFKNSINKASSTNHIFEDGFNDQIVSSKRNLNTLFNYIRLNPYRLAVRRANPDFFSKRNNLIIGDTQCQAYGNIHLLDNPFKDQVIIHRTDSQEQFTQNKEKWLYTAANGGVLVSPFISKREKETRAEAEELGGRFILISNAPLAERNKPAAHNFNLCSQGRMLIIAPQEPLDFSRNSCLRMNSLANTIASI